MNDDEKKLTIATFRFGLISDFVIGTKLDYGDKEKLLNEKLSRRYKIPFSERSVISRSTLDSKAFIQEREAIKGKYGPFLIQLNLPSRN